MTLHFKSREEWIESNPLLIRIVRLRRAVEAGISELSAMLTELLEKEAKMRCGAGDWFPKREPYIAATRPRKASGSSKTTPKRQDGDAKEEPPTAIKIDAAPR